MGNATTAKTTYRRYGWINPRIRFATLVASIAALVSSVKIIASDAIGVS